MLHGYDRHRQTVGGSNKSINQKKKAKAHKTQVCYTSLGTNVPRLVTVALIVSKKNGKVAFSTFDLDPVTLTLRGGHPHWVFFKAPCEKVPLCQVW